MPGEHLREIRAFVEVARERSFTRAAARLGVSQSALSHTIRALEARLGLRLLTRTTRSVAPTEAGERLMQAVAPRFEAIAQALAGFEEMRGKPAGLVRIAASDVAVNTILLPKLAMLQPDYPYLKLEVAIELGLTDIMADRFDAGVRFGDQISREMTAVPISPDIRMVVVGAPSYLASRPSPRAPADLVQHACITLRASLRGGPQAWELRKGKQTLQVRVDGPWTFNSVYPALDAALAGLGLAYMPEELALPHIRSGRLIPVLKAWWPTFPALHIFFSSRRQTSAALSLVVEQLRYRP